MGQQRVLDLSQILGRIREATQTLEIPGPAASATSIDRRNSCLFDEVVRLKILRHKLQIRCSALDLTQSVE